KTTTSDQNGRYTLSLPRGFYKLLITKPGLEQTSNNALRVRSNFKPIKVRIGMRTESKVENLATATSSSKQKREFFDASDIIEKFSGQSGDLGIKHLIK
ncbi:MAG: carboxypeptidase-like regulatory domain-containing protein, partial [Candidatus Berkelbacteria bacterium]|nr:carboxypeptidase-like regulatory domain-containing protein [Candidatus Berkelbacteria bacterium]